MIIPRGIQPDKSLYAIGATAIEVLKEKPKGDYNLDEIYSDFQKRYKKDITLSYFIYALDWLYLLGLVDVCTEPNTIKKCF